MATILLSFRAKREIFFRLKTPARLKLNRYRFFVHAAGSEAIHNCVRSDDSRVNEQRQAQSTSAIRVKSLPAIWENSALGPGNPNHRPAPFSPSVRQLLARDRRAVPQGAQLGSGDLRMDAA